jgi:hypothetical protein
LSEGVQAFMRNRSEFLPGTGRNSEGSKSNGPPQMARVAGDCIQVPLLALGEKH